MIYYGIANAAPSMQWNEAAKLPLDQIDNRIVAQLKVWHLRDYLSAKGVNWLSGLK